MTAGLGEQRPARARGGTRLLLTSLFSCALLLGALCATGCKSSRDKATPGADPGAPTARPLPPVTVQRLITTVPRGNLVDTLNDGHVLFAGHGRLDDIALEIGMDTVYGPAAPVALRDIAKTSDGTLLGWQVPEPSSTGKQLAMVLYALPPGAKAWSASGLHLPPAHPCMPLLVGDKLVAFKKLAIEVWDPATLDGTTRQDILDKTCLGRLPREDGSVLVVTNDGLLTLSRKGDDLVASAPTPLEGWLPLPESERAVVAPVEGGGLLVCRSSRCWRVDAKLKPAKAPVAPPQLGERASAALLGDGRTLVRGGGTLLFTWRPGDDGWRVHPDPGGDSGWVVVGDRGVVIAGHAPAVGQGGKRPGSVVTVRDRESNNLLDTFKLRSASARKKAEEDRKKAQRAAAKRRARYMRVDAQPLVALEVGKGHRADSWRVRDVEMTVGAGEHPVGFVQADARHAVLLTERTKELNKSQAIVFLMDEAGKVTVRREELKSFVGANHVRQTASGDKWIAGLRDGRGPVVERARVDLPMPYEALGAGLKMLGANTGLAAPDLTATYFYRPSPAATAGAIAAKGALDQARIGAAAVESPTGRLVLVGHDPTPLSKLPTSYTAIVKMLATYRFDIASERTTMTTVSALNLKTGSTTALPRMTTSRAYPGLSAMQDGRLLVTGGRAHPARESDHALPSLGPEIPETVFTWGSSELFKGGAWSKGPSLTPRAEHAQVSLEDGSVLVIGGVDRPVPKRSTRMTWPGVERWSTGKDAFSAVGVAPAGGYGHTLLRGPDGTLLYLTRSLNELVLVELSAALDDVTLTPLGVDVPRHRHDVHLTWVGERLLLVIERRAVLVERR